MKSFAVALLVNLLVASFPTTSSFANVPGFREGATAGTQSTDEPKYKIEIQTPPNGHPQSVLTNLYAEPLTAFVLETSLSSDAGARKVKMVWDAYVQLRPAIVKDGKLSLPLGHFVGSAYPDTAVIAAAVWEDGTTTGPSELLNLIFANRDALKGAYEWAIAFLQSGLQQDWNRTQYLQALGLEENKKFLTTQPGSSIKSTLDANASLDANRQALQSTVQRLLDFYTRKLEALLQAKPEIKPDPATS